MESALSYDIREPSLRIATRCAILNSIWNTSYTSKDFRQDPMLGSSFLRYYSEQCRNTLARHTTGVTAVITTHEDIIRIIQELQDPSSTRENIEGIIRARIPNIRQNGSNSRNDNTVTNNNNDVLHEAIELGMRLWLMIDIGTVLHSFIPGQKPLSWEEGSPRQLLGDHFGPHTAIQERVKLNKIFTARNLERIAGVNVVWTNNLIDHLRLMADDTKIAIFHHASFLECHKKSDVFPPGFPDETLQTLALLFPRYDKQSRKWFRTQQNKWGLDGKASSYGHLSTEERQVENFVFWHDRLVILKQVFDEAEPSTIAQWWCDRRRRVQWYTFWIAAMVLGLTILFGVIQCVEGGLQVYKAYYPTT